MDWPALRTSCNLDLPGLLPLVMRQLHTYNRAVLRLFQLADFWLTAVSRPYVELTMPSLSTTDYQAQIGCHCFPLMATTSVWLVGLQSSYQAGLGNHQMLTCDKWNVMAKPQRQWSTWVVGLQVFSGCCIRVKATKAVTAMYIHLFSDQLPSYTWITLCLVNAERTCGWWYNTSAHGIVSKSCPRRAAYRQISVNQNYRQGQLCQSEVGQACADWTRGNVLLCFRVCFCHFADDAGSLVSIAWVLGPDMFHVDWNWNHHIIVISASWLVLTATGSVHTHVAVRLSLWVVRRFGSHCLHFSNPTVGRDIFWRIMKTLLIIMY